MRNLDFFASTVLHSSCVYYKGYQQALEDFAIPNLLTCLKTYSDANFDAGWMNLTQPELESVAAILLRDLTANLKGKAIAGYLDDAKEHLRLLCRLVPEARNYAIAFDSTLVKQESPDRVK